MQPLTDDQLQQQLALDFATNVMLGALVALAVGLVIVMWCADRQWYGPRVHSATALCAAIAFVAVAAWLAHRRRGAATVRHNPYSATAWPVTR